jgi:transposase, IS605 OrfB family, central region
VSESLLVKAYSINHGLNVKDFVDDYMVLLKKVLNDLWHAIGWKKKGKRLVPFIKKDRVFRKELRDKYVNEWTYSKHYVDSAIKQTYSILESWRKRYLRGKAGKEEPTLKRRFIRIKETLYSYRNGIIKISIRPFQESISIDLRKAWFWDRIQGLELGELILKEGVLIITVRKKMELRVENPTAWDTNLLTLDGYDGVKDYTIDLKNIYTIHRTYELKRRRIQKLPTRTREKLLQKYRLREKNRVNDTLHKIAKQLANQTNIFEDLTSFKERVVSTRSRSLNRQNSKHDYIKLQKYIEYKSAWNGYLTLYVKPQFTSKTCSKCGYVNKDLKGAGVFECKRCGLRIDRQKNASRNIWNKFLRMWGSGFTPKGAKPNDTLPMNPEGDESDEAQELSMGSIRIHT